MARRKKAAKQKQKEGRPAAAIAHFLSYLLVAVLPFVVSLAGLDKFRQPKTVFVALVTAGLALSLYFAGRLDLRVRLRSWEGLLLLFLGYVGLHTLASELPGASWIAFLHLLLFVLLFFCLKSLGDPRHQRNLWLVGGLAMSVNALLAVLQYFGLFWNMVNAEGEVVSGRTSAGGLLGEVNSAGFLFALMALMMLYFLFVDESRLRQVLGGVVLVCNLVGLAFTQTLTAIMALGAVLLLWLILHHWWLFTFQRKLTKGLITLWVVLGLALVGAVGVGYQAGVMNRISRVLDQMQQGDWTMVTSGRQPVYYLAWEMAKEEPLLGRGLDTFGREFFYFRAETTEGQSVQLIRHFGSYRQAHNEYLQIWVELGILGLLAGILLLGILLLGAVRAARRLEDPGEVYWIFLLGLGVVFTAVTCLAFFPFHLTATAVYIILLLAGLRYFETPSPAESSAAAQHEGGGKRGTARMVGHGLVALLMVLLVFWQLARWQANREMGVAAYLLENATGGEFTPAQRRMFADESLARLEKVDSSWRAQAEIYNLRGTAEMLLGRYQEAAADYRQAIEYLPSPEVFVNLAAAYMATEQWDRAEECVELALRYEPRWARAHQALQQIREHRQ